MKKLAIFVLVVAVIAALAAGVVSFGKSRVSRDSVKSALADPVAEPTLDIESIVASAVAEALAAQAQPTPEAPVSAEPEKIVETVVVTVPCDCSLCNQPTAEAIVEATAEAVVEATEEAVVEATEEAAAETEKFQIGVKYTATVNMPVFTGVTYEGFGVIYTIEPDMVPAKKNTAVYGKPAQPQFALNGDLVGYRMIGMIPEVYQPQKMEYEYVQETELTIHELVAAVTVGNENGGFALRAESNKGQQPIAKLWLSEKEAEYWTICMREDGTFVVLMRTAAAVSAPKRAVVAQPSGGNGGGESHHEPGPGPEPTGPEPDPKHPPVVDPIFDDEPAPAPSNPEPNPTHPGVVDPVFD